MCEVFLYPYLKKTKQINSNQTRQPRKTKQTNQTNKQTNKQTNPEKVQKSRFKGYGFILRQQQQPYFCLWLMAYGLWPSPLLYPRLFIKHRIHRCNLAKPVEP